MATIKDALTVPINVEFGPEMKQLMSVLSKLAATASAESQELTLCFGCAEAPASYFGLHWITANGHTYVTPFCDLCWQDALTGKSANADLQQKIDLQSSRLGLLKT